MDREHHLETIRRQYTEEIQTAYQQCEHENGKTVDYTDLHHRLTRLMKTARVDGLPAKEFMELVKSQIPMAWTKIESTWFKVAA